ncbi:MAG: hypothetical protein ACRC7B_00250 [Metamycoplasmataceae bacterium]
MSYIKLLYLIFPISLILIILSLYFYINVRKKWLEKFFDKHKNTNSLSTNQKYTNELRSLSLVKNDTDTDVIKEEAATFAWDIEKLKRKNYSLATEGKNKIQKYQIWASNKVFHDIVANERKIDDLSNKFFKTVGTILENIKIARKEIVEYKNGLRELKNKINKNISEEKNPISKTLISNEFGRIESNLKDLDDYVGSNQMDKVAIAFANIKEDFLKLIKFANNCQELEKIIFNKIPDYFVRIETFFEKTKQKTNCNFSYISFYEQINSMKSANQISCSSFSIDNMEEIEKSTNKILYILGSLNREINREINSYNLILKNKDELGKYKKNISKLFLTIKNDLLVAHQIDKIYFSQFEEELNRLSNFIAEVDAWIERIKKDENNFEISFSSKQFKYKSLFYQLKGFYLLYVELSKKLEMFYLEGESNLLKFERLVILLSNMKSYIIRNYIILSPEENENALAIENLREKIVGIIINTPSNTNPNIVNEYKELLGLVSEFLLTVGIKIEISKLYIQVSELLAPKRSSDSKLNESVIMSENSYLDGNYDFALNNLIDTLNKGLN